MLVREEKIIFVCVRAIWNTQMYSVDRTQSFYMSIQVVYI
jgi:hypothetical protein